ncbi:SGNH/GDSL hydrolase family protein [Catonella sp.]|uniref:SGNH/GDSL hydrolase family protein n=1 Tax=Catonella sp. TaxID=2382125 RepID=UPI003F9F7FE2
MFGQKGYAGVDKKTKQNKTVLVIGDSIAYGMSKGKKSYTGVDDGDKVYWLAEGGINITLLHPNFDICMGKTMSKAVTNTFTTSKKFNLLEEVKKKKVEDIVVILGANWPGEKSSKLIVSCLKKLAKKSGCRVYYVNTLPYVDKGRYKNRENIMIKHNKMTRDGFKKSDIIYVDAYKIVKSVKGYHKYTSDGIHYSKKIYNAIFNEILLLVHDKEKVVADNKEKVKSRNKEKVKSRNIEKAETGEKEDVD